MKRQVGGIPKSLGLQMEDGNYYEALQLYRTLQSRYEASGDFIRSDELLFDGIINMNKYKQTISAYDLAVLYINSIKARKQSFSAEVGDRLLNILVSFPVGEEKEKLIGAFSQWCHSTANALVGYAKLNEYAGKYYWEQKQFVTSSDYYIISGNMDELLLRFACMLLEWATTGYHSEIDLFVTRPILWLASKKNLKDANSLLSALNKTLSNDQEFQSLPLIHFCGFILQTLERDAAPVFNLLKEKYASELARDPNLDKLMVEIGKEYYGIRPQGDMFSNMLKMFTGM